MDGGRAWWRSRARAIPSMDAASSSWSGAWAWMVLHVPVFSTEHANCLDRRLNIYICSDELSSQSQ
uniref:Uncharacterized protein n=1 Tax=Oryza brachyantha TaxID=4533 RepID=J3M634_ORYBR